MANKIEDQTKDATRFGIKVSAGVKVKTGPITPAANQATAKLPQNSAKTFLWSGFSFPKAIQLSYHVFPPFRWKRYLQNFALVKPACCASASEQK